MASIDTDTVPRAQSIGRRAFNASIYAYVGKFGNTLLAFPVTLLLVKGLSIEDYGAYSLFVSMLFLGSVLTNLGTLGVIQRFVPEFAQGNENGRIRQTVKSAIILRSVAGLACVGALLIFSDAIFSLLNLSERYQSYSFLVGLLILISIEVQLLGDGVLGALLDYRSLTIGRLSGKLLQLCTIYLAFSLGYGLKGVIVGWMASLVAPLIIYIYKVHKAVFKEKLDARPTLPTRRMARYGAFYLAGVFGTIFFDVAIDNFVIAHYLGEYEVGRYAFSAKVAFLSLSVVPINLMTPIVVNVAIRRWSEKKSTDVLSDIFALFNKLIFFSILPATVGVFVLSDAIITHLFDAKYASVDLVVKVILFFSVIKFFNYAFQTLVKPLELVHLSLYRYVCSFINLCLNLWLVPKMGILGAALATGSTTVLNYVIVVILLRRHVNLGQDWKAFAKMSLNLLAMAATIYALRGWVGGPTELIVVVLLGAGVYFLLSAFSKPFTDSERKLINGLLNRKMWIF
jgi:O-antigen/teichoic acid export membrane protein